MCFGSYTYIIFVDVVFLSAGYFYVLTGCGMDNCIYYTREDATLISINNTVAQFKLENGMICSFNNEMFNFNETYKNIFIDKHNNECIYDKQNILLLKFIAGIILLLVSYIFIVLTIYVYCSYNYNRIKPIETENRNLIFDL